MNHKMSGKRILITGISGFVGYHFMNYLYQRGDKVEIWGVDVRMPIYDYQCYVKKMNLRITLIDLLNSEELHYIVKSFQPDYVLHLASYSSVAYSWKYPVESFTNNTNIFLNLVTVIMKECPQCRILSVGSSEEYGSVTPEQLPLKETERLNPLSPYAVARVSQEMLSQIYVKNYGLNIILTRSFNHIGPHQDTRFVVPSFIDQILKIKESGKKTGMIKTGNLSVIRDFVDVREVVEAYYMLLLNGVVGEVYNVCSGRGISLKEIMELIAQQLGVTVNSETDVQLIRPYDNPIIVGDPSKLRNELEWESHIEIGETIKDMIVALRRVRSEN